MNQSAYIYDYIRTPIGRYGGALSSVRTDDLAAIPLNALMERNTSVDWKNVDDVFMGGANQAGDADHVKVNGGAIALGHPLGISVARITGSLALELKRRGSSRAIATMCIGVGQGISILIEAA